MIWIRRSGEGVFKFELDRKGVLVDHIQAASHDGNISVSDAGAHDTRWAISVSETG